MRTIIAQETKATNSGQYHVLNDAETGSLCGSINEESQFAADIAQTLSRVEAERGGLTICGRCAYIVT